MPAYEYREGGKIVVRVLPVKDRDTFPGRITIPSRLSVCPRGAPSQADEVLRGYYRSEEKLGTARVRDAEKALGMTHHQVKSLWAHDN